MAITSYGYDGSLDETKFAKLMRRQGEVAYKHGVTSGFNTTAGAGTRQTVVSAGAAILTGVPVDSDANVTLTHTANSSSATRTDYVVLQIDWTSNAASVVIVQGSSATPPVLTQTEGGIWQMPLARVAVRASVTTILANDVTICKPLPRTQAIVYSVPITQDSVAPTAAAKAVATQSVSDPGWPYRIRMNAGMAFTSNNGGFGRIIGDVTQGATTTTVGRAQAEYFVGSPETTASFCDVSGVLAGPCVATLSIIGHLMTAGSGALSTASSDAGLQYFTVEVVPA